MNALLRVYQAQLQQEIATRAQYRVQLALWIVGLILQPVIYLAVWTAVAQSSGGTVGEYGIGDFASYFIVLLIVKYATDTWVIFTSGFRVQTGSLSPLLLRPIHPIHADLAANLAQKVVNLAIVLPTTFVLVVIFRPTLAPTLWQIGLFVLAVVLALLLRFVLDWVISMLAFWVTQMAAIDQAYQVALLFLSGQIAPLVLLPTPIHLVATILPFRWIVAFPVELLLGRLSPLQIAWGFAAQAGWLMLVLALLRPLWQRGLYRYAAVGA